MAATSTRSLHGRIEDRFEVDRLRELDTDPTVPPSVVGVANEVVPETTNVYSAVEVDPADPREVARRQALSRPVVRRPTLGLVGYEDRWATIEVVVRSGTDGQGESLELFNSTYAEGRNPVNTNFMLQRIDSQRVETAQVVRTFGDWYINDVGENPNMLKVQGMLFEARNFPWLAEWQKNYETYLRARQCILRRALVYLTVDDTMYVGYIVNTATARSTDTAWTAVPFSFDMLLRNVVDVRAVSLFPSTPAEADTFLGFEGEYTRFVNGIPVSELSLASAIMDPDATTVAHLAEIVSGRFEGQVNSLSQPVLEFEGRLDEAVFRVNVDELVRVARAINAATGRQFVDIQGVRNDYLTGRRAEFEGMGIATPEAQARYGFPSRYQTEVDARRQRTQEEYRDAIERGFRRARTSRASAEWT